MTREDGNLVRIATGEIAERTVSPGGAVTTSVDGTVVTEDPDASVEARDQGSNLMRSVVDDLDASIWTSIGLNKVMQNVEHRMYDAARNEGQRVTVTIDNKIVADFYTVKDGNDEERIHALIDGTEVAAYLK